MTDSLFQAAVREASRRLTGQLSCCPFCGTKDALGINSEGRPVVVRCEICDVTFEKGYHSTVSETIAAWNNRG